MQSLLISCFLAAVCLMGMRAASKAHERRNQIMGDRDSSAL
jgi:hypothetical protein